MRQIKTTILLLLAVLLASSCLSSSDGESTRYSDAAISSFTLGTLYRYTLMQLDNDKDTIIKSTVTGSSYKFHINQLTHEIYNTDSLPMGTDVSKVVAAVTTRNSGTLVIKDITSDTLRYYLSTDSIDFTSPRIFTVFASDGSGQTDYKVSVNAHQEDGDVMTWELMSSADEPKPIEYDVPMDGIKQILGNSLMEIYGLSNDNRLMVWRIGENKWEEEGLDEDAAMLPTQDLQLVCYSFNLADETQQVLLIGNRSVEQYPQEATAMVWRKIVDYGDYAPESHWICMTPSGDDLRFALPRMEKMQMVSYDDGLLVLGGMGIGGCQEAPYSQFYFSRDNGITWKDQKGFKLPDQFNYNATSVHMWVDDDQFLWLLCEGTGQIWRARLNRLMWQYN